MDNIRAILIIDMQKRASFTEETPRFDAEGVVEDGHTTSDRPHISAETVIAHYNWVWQNMIPTEGSIKVRPFSGYRLGRMRRK